MPVEKDAEDDCVAWCKAQGGLAVKLKIEGERGFPDRTLLFPGGLALFVELKTPRGKTSKQQDKWIARLRELGFVCEVVRTLAECRLAVMAAKVKANQQPEPSVF